MEKIIAFCGMNCAECPVYIATQKGDEKERKKVAEKWAKEFNSEIKPEDINCDGCLSESGRVFGYCKVCEIRNCGLKRGVENCAFCDDYPCEKLNKLFNTVPAARLTLEKLREQRHAPRNYRLIPYFLPKTGNL